VSFLTSVKKTPLRWTFIAILGVLGALGGYLISAFDRLSEWFFAGGWRAMIVLVLATALFLLLIEVAVFQFLPLRRNSRLRKKPMTLIIVFLLCGIVGVGIWIGLQKISSAIAREPASTEQPRIKLDLNTADYEGRKIAEQELAKTRQELASTKSEYEQRLAALDPLRQNIYTASLIATVEVSGEKPKPGLAMNIGGNSVAAFAVRKEAVLVFGTNTYGADSSGNYYFNAPCGTESKWLGKQIKELRLAEYLQIIHRDIKEETEVSGGEAILIINGNVRLTFKIPPQKTTMTGKNEFSVLVRDLSEGFSPLLK
jgi:hypothetical protein